MMVPTLITLLMVVNYCSASYVQRQSRYSTVEEVVRTPDTENDLMWLKRRETALQNELSRVRKKIEVLEGGEISEALVDEDCGCDDEVPEAGENESKSKKKSTKRKKKE